MKKNTGIRRKLDELGRVVIPKELRDKFDLKVNDELEIYVTNDGVFLKVVKDNCLFCNSENNLKVYMDRHICENCMNKIIEKLH